MLELPEEPEQPTVAQGTLYLRLPGESDERYRKIKAIAKMFPGESQMVVYFADTKRRVGARVCLDSRMLMELQRLLGNENVVVK